MSHRSDVTLGGAVDANRPCTVEALIKQGDQWDLYKVTHDGRPAVLKISNSEAGDERVLNEAFALTNVRTAVEDRFHPYFPVLYDVFDHEGRQAVVTAWLDGFFSLQEVIEAYPDGVDVKDMAWMCRRVMVALGAIHRAKYIHGAVFPTNLLIHPEMHGLVVVNWSYAVPSDGTIASETLTTDSHWTDWYPDSIRLHAAPPHRGIDTLLAARSLVAVCNGDIQSVTIPGASREFRAFFQACFGPNVPDAWGLKIAFDELIEDLWGPKKFRPFTMPVRQNGSGSGKTAGA